MLTNELTCLVEHFSAVATRLVHLRNPLLRKWRGELHHLFCFLFTQLG
jgi:hypothetical protein